MVNEYFTKRNPWTGLLKWINLNASVVRIAAASSSSSLPVKEVFFSPVHFMILLAALVRFRQKLIIYSDGRNKNETLRCQIKSITRGHIPCNGHPHPLRSFILHRLHSLMVLSLYPRWDNSGGVSLHLNLYEARTTIHILCGWRVFMRFIDFVVVLLRKETSWTEIKFKWRAYWWPHSLQSHWGGSRLWALLQTTENRLNLFDFPIDSGKLMWIHWGLKRKVGAVWKVWIMESNK